MPFCRQNDTGDARTASVRSGEDLSLGLLGLVGIRQRRLQIVHIMQADIIIHRPLVQDAVQVECGPHRQVAEMITPRQIQRNAEAQVCIHLIPAGLVNIVQVGVAVEGVVHAHRDLWKPACPVSSNPILCEPSFSL